MKFIALVKFDNGGIPNFYELGTDDGNGYSRVGQVPQAGTNMVAVNTTAITKAAMEADEDIVIVEEII